MFPHPTDWAGYQYPDDGLLQAFNGEKALPVVKNGITTVG
jgi:hypothetical protein